MKKSKLIALLATFSKEECREFAEFLRSPFYNKNEDLERLFALLRKAWPEFEEGQVDRRRIMARLYPKASYDDRRCKHVMNFLLKQAELYISLKEAEHRPLIRDYHLLNAYARRGIAKNFNFIKKRADKKLEGFTKRDASYYYRSYLIKEVSSLFMGKQNIRRKDGHTQSAADAFDVHYFANKLRYTCHMLSNLGVVSDSYDLRFVDEMIRYVKAREDLSATPAIRIYFVLYRLLTEQDDELFAEMKRLLDEFNALFDTDELKQLYIILINYCIRRLEEGKRSKFYLHELYQIYQQGINNSVLLDGGYLSPWTFKNVVKLGLRLELFERTEAFISDNIGRLREEFRSDALHYNMAELKYYGNQPRESLAYLTKVEFSDIYYILDTKKLMLKIYYETEEFEALWSLISSFQAYLRRNKLISANVRNSYANFTRLLGRLERGGEEGGFAQRIKETSPLIDKKWLLAQAARKEG